MRGDKSKRIAGPSEVSFRCFFQPSKISSKRGAISVSACARLFLGRAGSRWRNPTCCTDLPASANAANTLSPSRPSPITNTVSFNLSIDVPPRSVNTVRKFTALARALFSFNSTPTTGWSRISEYAAI